MTVLHLKNTNIYEALYIQVYKHSCVFRSLALLLTRYVALNEDAIFTLSGRRLLLGLLSRSSCLSLR